jgi:hypothetical protein
MNAPKNADASDSAGKSPKDFTTAIPMIDLGEVVKIVTSIQSKGLETGSMDTVAEKLGFKGSTSTPFYYRMRAARLFGLLSSKSALSDKARDYIKPHEEGMQAGILADAVLGIPQYADWVNELVGKKLNVELLGHKIEKDRTLNLTSGCALICARTFENSLKFAGMLSDDGSVCRVRTRYASKGDTDPPAGSTIPAAPLPPPPPADVNRQVNNQDNGNTLTQTMYLDKSKSRVFSIIGPVTVTKAEYERICKWLEVVVIVEENGST